MRALLGRSDLQGADGVRLQDRPEYPLGGQETPPTARALRDRMLKFEVTRAHWKGHGSVYGADKVWPELNLDGTRTPGAPSSRNGRLGLSGQTGPGIARSQPVRTSANAGPLTW